MSGGDPDVAVVVSTRDRADRLPALLAALAAQSIAGRAEVVIVDNGSVDATSELLAERSRGDDRMRVLTRDRGRGPGPARDEGWRATRAPLVAFTDDDCEPEPDWLERLLERAGETGAEVLQGRTLPLAREGHLLGPLARTQRIESPSLWFATCNVLYPRAALERVGGFSDRFGDTVGGEDTDLAWRVIESGGSVAFAPDAVVRHGVEPLSPRAMLALALRWSDAMAVLRLHPRLRREALQLGIFWKTSHRDLAAAAVGLALARAFPPALLLALPYARNLRARCRALDASPGWAAWLVTCDLVETYAAARGGIRHRVLVL